MRVRTQDTSIEPRMVTDPKSSTRIVSKDLCGSLAVSMSVAIVLLCSQTMKKNLDEYNQDKVELYLGSWELVGASECG